MFWTLMQVRESGESFGTPTWLAAQAFASVTQLGQPLSLMILVNLNQQLVKSISVNSIASPLSRDTQEFIAIVSVTSLSTCL